MQVESHKKLLLKYILSANNLPRGMVKVLLFSILKTSLENVPRRTILLQSRDRIVGLRGIFICNTYDSIFSIQILSTSFEKALFYRHYSKRVYWEKEVRQKKNSIHFMCIKQIHTQYGSTFPTVKNALASLHRGKDYRMGNRKKPIYVHNALLCFKWSYILRKNFNVDFIQIF